MSDGGEGSDGGGGRAHLSESPSPPLSVSLPRGLPSSPRPLDFCSSASPLLGDTDPPYLASSECLHPSPESRELGGSTHFTPPKFRQRAADTVSTFLSRPDVRIDAGYDDDPLPKWRGRGSPSTELLQHRGQRLHRTPELSDYGNHYSAEHLDTDFNSDSRQS